MDNVHEYSLSPELKFFKGYGGGKRWRWRLGISNGRVVENIS